MATSQIVMDIPQQDIDENLVDVSSIISAMETLASDNKTGKLITSKYYYMSGSWLATYWSYNWIVDSTNLSAVASAFATFKSATAWATNCTPVYVAYTVTTGS